MGAIPCAHCMEMFLPRNKRQRFCLKAECQRARKAAWQRVRIKTDPAYRAEQRLSWKKWALNNPGYWKGYRRKNPEKAERNRILQSIRNGRRRRHLSRLRESIAKMDVRKRHDFEPVGRFWLVPLIAKMDARKVTIYTITDTW